METDAKEFWHELAADRKTVWAYLESVVRHSSVGNYARTRAHARQLMATGGPENGLLHAL